MTALRGELAEAVGDQTGQRWQAAAPPAGRASEAPAEAPAAHPWLQDMAGLEEARVAAEGNLLLALRDAGGRLCGLEAVSPQGEVADRLGQGKEQELFHIAGGRLGCGGNPKCTPRWKAAKLLGLGAVQQSRS